VDEFSETDELAMKPLAGYAIQNILTPDFLRVIEHYHHVPVYLTMTY
jgi:hypothetical protein